MHYTVMVARQTESGALMTPEYDAEMPSTGPIDLGSFEKFRSHPWVDDLSPKFRDESVLAKRAMLKGIEDLRSIAESWRKANNRALFTTIDGRVKTEVSFFQKLFEICKQRGAKDGFTQDTLAAAYEAITDLCGLRFACPYWDDVEYAINEVLRPLLESRRGYAVKPPELKYADRNYLDSGSPVGYRSYHFFLKIPTQIDIYGRVKHCP